MQVDQVSKQLAIQLESDRVKNGNNDGGKIETCHNL